MINWQTFVVRIWQEGSSGTWRGQIVHLPDQAAGYFATMQQAADFMAQFVPGINSPVEADGSAASRPHEGQP